MPTTPGDQNELHQLKIKQHNEFLYYLLSLTYGAALTACNLIDPSTWEEHWQAAEIHQAIIEVADQGVKAAHADEPLLASDVNAHLVASGKLENSELQRYWISLVSPADPRPLAPYRAKELAGRINESAFRSAYHRVYSSSNERTTFARPVDDLHELIRENTEHLRSFYSRTLGKTTTLKAVGDAA